MERLFLVTRRPENPTERLVCLAEAGYYGRILSASRSRTCAVQSIRQAEPRTDRKKRTPRGPRLHDVICQTRTLAAPEAAATASLQFSQFIVAEAAISFLGG